jgi:hypothetical protein
VLGQHHHDVELTRREGHLLLAYEYEVLVRTNLELTDAYGIESLHDDPLLKEALSP